MLMTYLQSSVSPRLYHPSSDALTFHKALIRSLLLLYVTIRVYEDTD